MTFNPVPTDQFPRYNRPWTNVTPFTYRDGVTFLEKIERMQWWIRDVLTKHIDDEMAAILEAWQEYFNVFETTVIEILAEYREEWEEKSQELDQKFADLEQQNAAQFEQMTQQIQEWINNQITANDEIVSALVELSDSETRSSLDNIYAAITVVNDLTELVDQRNQESIERDQNLGTGIANIGQAIIDLDEIAVKFPDSRNPGTILSTPDSSTNEYVPLSISDGLEIRDDEIRSRAEVIYATEYGVIGDGVANDSVALQNALDAAENRILDIGNLHIRIGAIMEFSHGMTLRGHGNATITRLDSYAGTMFVNFEHPDTTTTAYNGRGNITLEGVTFDGNSPETSANMVLFVHCANIIVRDCVFLNCTGHHHLELNSVNGGLVHNCRFEGYTPVWTRTVRSEAIQIDGAHENLSMGGAQDNTPTKNVTVDSCYFTDVNVAVGGHNRVGGSNRYEDIRIVNCYGEGLYIAGLWFIQCVRLHCEGNNFTLARRPVPGHQSEAAHTLRGIAVQESLDSILNNNHISFPNDINETGANAFDIRATSTRTMMIGNKILYGNTPFNINQSSHCTIENNMSLGCNGTAVDVIGSDGTMVSGNYFASGSRTGASLIRLRLTESTGSRVNNIIGNVSSPATGNPPNYGVLTSDLSGSNYIAANRFRGVGTIHGSQGTGSDIVANTNTDQ